MRGSRQRAWISYECLGFYPRSFADTHLAW
jgi:hypothetical protein